MKNNNKQISTASELPVYKDTYELVMLLLDYEINFAKPYRGSLGNKLINESLSLFNLLQSAHRHKLDKDRKREILEDFLSQFDLVKSVIRMCTEKKLISIKQTATIAKYMECITKQITGWKNK